MKHDDHVIVGIHIRNRVKRVPGIQNILTAFGSCIKTRIGLHNVDGRSASGNGLIIVELVGPQKKISDFCKKLGNLAGVEIQVMMFGHD